MTSIKFTADTTSVHVVLNHVIAVTEPIVKEELGYGMRRAGKEVATYPPPLPNQKYVRTGIYGMGVTVVPLGNQGYALTMTAKHKGRAMSSYVGGNNLGRGQARIHIGRWVVARIAVDEEVYVKVPQAIDKRLQAEIDRVDKDN